MKGKTPSAVEEWRTVPGYGGHYEVSSMGRVRSKQRELEKRTRYGGVMQQTYPAKMLSLQERKGYLFARIGVDGVKYSVPVHHMVLSAFVRCREEGEICRHLDGSPQNNQPGNLAWGTHEENMEDRKAHGNYFTGEKHVMASLTNEQVMEIYSSDERTMDVANKYGTCATVVSAIRRGATWKAVTGGVPRESRAGKSYRKTDKMDAQKARQVRALIAGGARQDDVAAMFGVTQSAVSRIVSNKTWTEAA